MDREIRVDPAALRDFTKDLTSILNDVLLPGLERQKYLFTDPVTFGESNPSGELYQRRMETAQAIKDGHENLAKQIASFQFLIEAVGKIADGYQSSDALSEGALQTVLKRATGIVPGVNTPAQPSAGPAPSAGEPPSSSPAPATSEEPAPSAGPAPSGSTDEPPTETESVPLDNDQMQPAMVEEA